MAILTGKFGGMLVAIPAVVALAVYAGIGADILTASLTDPDGPAHYTTGVMVYEFLRHPFQASPVSFAESFYVRFPKVAFGHWPPGLYLLQASWFLVFGPSILSARLLTLATVLLISAWLTRRLWTSHGSAIAIACGALFACLTPVQHLAWTVNADLLVAALVLLAMTSLSDTVRSQKALPAGLFGLWLGAAILCKGSAWSGGITAVVTPIACRQLGLFLNWRYYAGGIMACLLGLPFYLLANVYRVGYPVHFEWMTNATLPPGSRWAAVWLFFQYCPALLAAIAAVGLCDSAWRCWARGDQSQAVVDSVIAGCWIGGQMAFLYLFPITPEGRVYLPSVVVALFPFARGIEMLRSMMSGFAPIFRLFPMMASVLSIALSWAVAPVPAGYGLGRSARLIPVTREGDLMLVSSSFSLDGAWIAERLAMDPFRAGVILRANHLFAESYWSGFGYKLTVSNGDEMRRQITELPVHYIILIRSGAEPEHQLLLRQTIESTPEQFATMGSFALPSIAKRPPGEVSVFENRLAAGRRPAVVRVKLGLDRGGRVLEYRWR